MSWLPHMLSVMWEVLQRLRCDRTEAVTSVSSDLLTVQVPTPSLAREHCRWCRLLEDETYEPVEVQTVTRVELATVEVTRESGSLEREILREARVETYGEVREREGRHRERQQEDDWRGRSPGRRWRGRSVSRGPDSRELSQGGWRGRVESGEVVMSGRDREWRGRSPGLGGGDW